MNTVDTRIQKTARIVNPYQAKSASAAPQTTGLSEPREEALLTHKSAVAETPRRSLASRLIMAGLAGITVVGAMGMAPPAFAAQHFATSTREERGVQQFHAPAARTFQAPRQNFGGERVVPGVRQGFPGVRQGYPGVRQGYPSGRPVAPVYGGVVRGPEIGRPGIGALRGPYYAPRPELRGQVFNAWPGRAWGPHYGNPWGFWGGPGFWLGMTVGNLINYDLWATQPVYVVSPFSEYNLGELPPPVYNSPIPAQTQLQLNVLNLMANPQQDPNNYDPTAGLYAATGPTINPGNPGAHITSGYAYNLLRRDQPIYFHSPNGAFERLQNLGDLDAYIYTLQQTAPAGASVLPAQP